MLVEGEESQYVRILTQGRKSGRSHQVLVRFISLSRDKIAAFPFRTGRQDWVLNVKKTPTVDLYLASGAHYRGTTRVKLISDLRDPILSIFTRKYGTETVRRWYFGQLMYVEIELEPRGGSANLAQIVYDDLETAFDGVAEDYDRHIYGNPVNSWLRTVSVETMTRVFVPGTIVLEIGCGTGTETLSLARLGVKVIASDLSGKMLRVLMRKAHEQGVEKNVVPLHCTAPKLAEKIRGLGYTRLDGAYSTYGAINTEPDLPGLVRNLRTLLKEESPLLLGVWNKYCAYEIFGYLARASPGMAFARLRNPVPIGKSRFCVATNAFSVRSLDSLLNPSFRRRETIGVVVSLPPSNLTKYLPRGKRLLRGLERFDNFLGRTFPFDRLGDHFLALYTLNRGYGIR